VVLRLRIPTAGATPGLSGEVNPIHVFATSSEWIESGVGGITWDTRPAVGSFLGGRAGLADVWLEIALPPSAIPANGGAVSFVLDEQGGSFGRLGSRNLDPDGTGSAFAVGDYAPRLRVVTASDGIADNTDVDADGLPDAWEIRHGLDANTTTSGTSDADGDGRPLRLEYLLGRDPSVAEPLAGDIRLEAGSAPGRLRIVFRRSSAGPAAKFNTTLSGNWTTLTTEADLTAAGFTVNQHTETTDAVGFSTHTYEFTPGAGTSFFFRLGQ
jgi:hypothetical protein